MDSRRVRSATKTRRRPTPSVAARRYAVRSRWRPDSGAPLRPSRPPGSGKATDANSDGQRKIRRADRWRARRTEKRAQYPVRRSRSRHARTHARRARCWGSSPPSARSSAGRRQAARPPTAPSHGGRETRNRRRNAARGCPSSPRSGASARCARKPRATRSGSPLSRVPARRAAIRQDVPSAHRSPRRCGPRRSGRNIRCGRPRAATGRRQGPSPPPRLCAPPPCRLPAPAPAPCRHALAQNRDRRQWRGHRHRARRDKRSAPDRCPRHRRPAPRPSWLTR